MSVPNHIIRQAKDASLPITMRIGKSGLTDSVIVELEGQLSSRSLVKVKVNRGLYPRDDLKKVWNVMGEKTNSSVVFTRGNVAVFWRN
ncbi:YhbY family RNA-binding protein [Candidatus Poseidoniales archaeon]|nr:YhbY family RNA-binding protein [Candidatus Poseidoniales archaeon]